MRNPGNLLSLVSLAFFLPAMAAAGQIQFSLSYQAGIGRVEPPSTDGLQLQVRNDRPGSEIFSLRSSEADLAPGIWLLEGSNGLWMTPREVRFDVTARKPSRIPVTMVPACTVAVDRAKQWRNDEEVEILSLEFGGAYRRRYESFSSLKVPAGKLVVSRIRNGSRVAILPLFECDPGKDVQLPYPVPPRPGHFTLFVNLAIPSTVPTVSSFGSQDTEPKLEPAVVSLVTKGVPHSPSITILNPSSQIAIFSDLATSDTWTLMAANSLFQTLSEDIEAIDGTVLSLDPLTLKPRKRIETQVEYQPKRPHRQAEMVLAYCGFEAGARSCKDLRRQPLTEGLQAYSFESLDWGQYRLRAEIDDYVLEGMGRGMGHQAAPFLKYDDAAVPSETYSISESHIFGRLLSEGEAVAGNVTLSNPANANDKVLSFPTDDELYFHIYYFGADESVYSQPRSEKGKRPPIEIPRAIPMGYVLTACDEGGFCRRFNRHSRIRGEGQFDIELGPRSGLELAVIDAATSKPVEAVVLVDAESKAVLFEDGEVKWVEPDGAEGNAFRTTDGRVRIPLNTANATLVRVVAEGYETFAEDLSSEPQKFLRRTVRLERKSRNGLEFGLEFADGTPVVNAFLLSLGREGQRMISCNTSSDTRGRVFFKAPCLQGARFVVMQPAIAISVLEEGQVVEGGKAVLQRAPQLPYRLRFTRAGEPVSGLSIGLKYPTFTLGPDDFLAGAPSGNLLFYQSNFQGEIALRGVDPAAPVVVEVDGRTFPLQPGSRILDIPLD